MAKKPVRRYTAVFPKDLLDDAQAVADERGETLIDVLRHFARFGLYLSPIIQSPETKLIVRRGDTEQEIIVL